MSGSDGAVTPQSPDAAVVAECLRRLSSRDETVATAESLTAGLVAATLAALPGASAVLRGGVATYATDAKTSVLHVPKSLIDEYGVVSAQCAEAMAQSVRKLFGATWGVSATGVAGPERQEGRDVGTVYVGLVGPDVEQVRELALAGDRNAIRTESVCAALQLLLTQLPK